MRSEGPASIDGGRRSGAEPEDLLDRIEDAAKEVPDLGGHGRRHHDHVAVLEQDIGLEVFRLPWPRGSRDRRESRSPGTESP